MARAVLNIPALPVGVSVVVGRAPAWERLDTADRQGRRRKCSTWLRHKSGVELRHCGHPTANFPYYLTDPAWPGCAIVSHNGRGFVSLAVALELGALLGRGSIGSSCVDPGCSTRTLAYSADGGPVVER